MAFGARNTFPEIPSHSSWADLRTARTSVWASVHSSVTWGPHLIPHGPLIKIQWIPVRCIGLIVHAWQRFAIYDVVPSKPPRMKLNIGHNNTSYHGTKNDLSGKASMTRPVVLPGEMLLVCMHHTITHSNIFFAAWPGPQNKSVFIHSYNRLKSHCHYKWEMERAKSFTSDRTSSQV